MLSRIIRFLESTNTNWFIGITTLFGLITAILDLATNDNKLVVYILVFITILFMLLVILIFISKKRKAKIERLRQLERRSTRSNLLKNPSLMETCQYLNDIVEEKPDLFKNSTLTESTSQLFQDFQDNVLRIYIFGHQSAGKSSLVNKLVGAEISPVFLGKMTTCLIRVRPGKKSKILARWGKRYEDLGANISKLKAELEKWDSWSLENRPEEVILEIPRKILDVEKVELVDTPGTGSARQSEDFLSFEDKIVKEAMTTAAVVIFVYRVGQTQTEAHQSILRSIANKESSSPRTFTFKPKVIAVCNLDFNWAGALREDRRGVVKLLGDAEKEIRKLVQGKCYRIAISSSPEVEELAVREGGTNIEELKTALVNLLSDRQHYVIQQTVNVGLRLSEQLIEHLTNIVEGSRSKYDQIETGRREVLKCIQSVQEVLYKGYKDEIEPINTSFIFGGVLGGGFVAFVAIFIVVLGIFPPTMPLALVIGIIIISSIISSIFSGISTHFSNQEKIKKYHRELKAKWSSLTNSIQQNNKSDNQLLVSWDIVKEMSKVSVTEDESSARQILIEIEKNLQSRIKHIEGYALHIDSLSLLEKTKEAANAFMYNRSLLEESSE
jgi:predicted GTPase